MPDFGQYLPISRLENEISRIITKVCHFFSRLDFPTIKFQLFCIVWGILMLTSNVCSSTPVCCCNIIIWLVFAHLVSFEIHNSWTQWIVFAQMTSFAFVLWHHLPLHYQFSIFKDVGSWQPCTEMRWCSVRNSKTVVLTALKLLGS